MTSPTQISWRSWRTILPSSISEVTTTSARGHYQACRDCKRIIFWAINKPTNRSSMFSYEKITRPKTKSSFHFCPCLPPSGPRLSWHRNEATGKQSTNYRQSALQTAEKENTDRIPFTLTFHPHNHAVKSIILNNIKLLQNDSETGIIFSQPPLISFKRDKDIGNFLVRSSF